MPNKIKLNKCCGEYPGITQLNVTGPSVIISCSKCKRKVWKHTHVHGKDYWEQAVEEWNNRAEEE